MSILALSIGQDQLERLSRILGGTRLRIPGQLDNGNAPEAFARRVGNADLAVLLILHFGDSVIYVPRLTLGGGPERVTVKAVMRLTERGKSAGEIALILHCSNRAVYRKRAKHKAATHPVNP